MNSALGDMVTDHRLKSVAWLVGFVALGLLPWLIDNQFVLLMISLVGITYLAALGLSLVMGFAGQVSLGHAALVGVGAYTSAILTQRYALPFIYERPVLDVSQHKERKQHAY
jgi:branched-chain amino acid transport system permease protein